MSVRRHQINYELGHATVKAERFIKECLDVGAYFRTKESDAMKYVVSLLQVYKNKWQVNVKPNVSFPLHTNLLDFIEEMRI